MVYKKNKMLKELLKDSLNCAIEPGKILYRLAWLVKHSNKAYFPAEISEPIKVPFHFDILGWDQFWFFSRSNNEPLMREVAATLIRDHSPKERSVIIDIGAWIGDNSLAWAKLSCKSDTQVLAIDPSRKNINFIKRAQRANHIYNLQAVYALCSSQKDSNYSIKYGDINHGSFLFTEEKRNTKDIQSTTLDSLAKEHCRGATIFLLHVDVEGMEAEVLKGAHEIISKDKPFIVFENHLNTEKKAFEEISVLLNSHGYGDIYMINEVLPDCRADCRNFIAFHSSRTNPIASLEQCFEKAHQNSSFRQATMPYKALVKVCS